MSLARTYLRYGPGLVGKEALARRLDARFARRPRRRTVATPVGPTEVDTADLIDRYLYLFGRWEPHLTRWLPTRLGPGNVFVDIGAHTGWFSRVATLAGADAVAVEPSPDALAVLHRHLAGCRGPGGARAVHAAIGTDDGERAFGLPDPGNRGGATALADPAAPVAFVAPTRRLDAVLSADEIARTRVVKIDVEGDEAEVVDALAGLLPRMRPDVEIAVEVAPGRLAERGRTPADVVDPLVAAGFAVYRVPNDYRPDSYPEQARRAARHRPPVPFDEPITVQHDLVFSRLDPSVARPA